MKPTTGLGINELIEVVQKKKVLKRRNGIEYLCKYPTINKDRQPTPGQLQVQENFKKWSAYAQEAIKDPVLKNAYGLMTKDGQTAYNRAFSDACHAPKVLAILPAGYFGRIGNSIYINVEDDFMVKRVLVFIYKGKKLIEEGEAVQCAANIWEYKAMALLPKTKGLTIAAQAEDMPGNYGKMEVKL